MGLIGRVFTALFGDGRNAIAETAEVFRINADKGDARAAQLQQEALSQFGREFAMLPGGRKGLFDQLMDALNRLPRPMLAFGTIGLFVMAMRDPVWFASRMEGVALVPEPLWWLMGAIVSFYFGARHQAHTQAFQKSIAESLARLPAIAPQRSGPRDYDTGPNPALDAWRDAA
ncbi:MAG: carboxylesterase [Proteobacteria bacterium]|nr:MAG: carboxylesterase [Pseudomonadota bacterium]